jgi:hypothetical protein
MICNFFSKISLSFSKLRENNLRISKSPAIFILLHFGLSLNGLFAESLNQTDLNNAVDIAKGFVDSLSYDDQVKESLSKQLKGNRVSAVSTTIYGDDAYSLVVYKFSPKIDINQRSNAVRQIGLFEILKSATYSSDEFVKKLSKKIHAEDFKKYLNNHYPFKSTKTYKIYDLKEKISTLDSFSICISTLKLQNIISIINAATAELDDVYNAFLFKKAQHEFANKDYASCELLIEDILHTEPNSYQPLLLKYKSALENANKTKAETGRVDLIKRAAHLIDDSDLKMLSDLSSKFGLENEASAWDSLFLSKIKKGISISDFQANIQ